MRIVGLLSWFDEDPDLLTRGWSGWGCGGA